MVPRVISESATTRILGGVKAGTPFGNVGPQGDIDAMSIDALIIGGGSQDATERTHMVIMENERY